MLPHINELIPSSACNQPLNKDAKIQPINKLSMLVIHRNHRVLSPVIPHPHCHIIRARNQNVLPMRRELHHLHPIGMPCKRHKRRLRRAHVPNPDCLVNGRRSEDTLIVLVPIAGQHLVVMRGDDDVGSTVTDVPNADSAIAGGGGEDIGMAGGPRNRVHAVCVLLERADAGGAINGPELEGIVPGGGDEGIPADRVPIDTVDLAGVLVEGANGVGRGWELGVPEFDGAIGDGGDGKGVMGLRPGTVVDAIGGFKGSELGDDAGGRGEVEDVEAAIADEAEVLGGGDEDAGLVEGAELHGVTIELGSERWHRRFSRVFFLSLSPS